MNTATQNESIPKKWWIGYDTQPLKITRQSKYSPDLLTIPTVLAEVEDGDIDPRFDQDLEGS